MCLAVPGRILEMTSQDPPRGIVDLEGVRREVSLELVMFENDHEQRSAQLGDWVLVHVGFALSVVDEQEARETLELLRQMGDAFDEEIAQIAKAE